MRPEVMKIIKEAILEKLRRDYPSEWLIPSNSRKGEFHKVRSNGSKYICDCIAFQMGKECSHIKKVKNEKEM
jgi:hypothetical protein